MKSSVSAVWICTALLTMCAHAADRQPYRRQETVKLTATVEKIDPATRTLVLKGESGQRAEVVVRPEVRNFDQLKVGDRITIDYTVGLAAQIQPPGTAPVAATPTGEPSLQRAPAGAKPGLAAADSMTATVKIDSVDPEAHTVTFTGADGIARTVEVEHPKGQEFIRTLKSGDAVQLTYTEATAISVQPAKP